MVAIPAENTPSHDELHGHGHSHEHGHGHDHAHSHGHAHGGAAHVKTHAHAHTEVEVEGDFIVPSTTGPRARRLSHEAHGDKATATKLPPLQIDAAMRSTHAHDDAHDHGHDHDHAHDHHGHSHGHKEKKLDDHDHDHHGHGHAHDDEDTLDIDQSAVDKLKQACMTSTVFMIMQFLGGYYAGSLAIMTDAAHLLSDVASFLVSLFAIYVGSRAANARMPFGYYRAEVLGALISVLIIWVLTGGLLYAAICRLIQQSEPGAVDSVDGRLMFLVSGCGLVVNLVLMRILGHGHSHGGHGHSHGGHGHSHGSHGGKKKAKDSHGHSHGAVAKNHQLEDDLESQANGVQPSPNTQDGTTYLKTPMSAVALIDLNECDDEHSHHSAEFENINVRAAYIHALGDFIQNLGVCVAGALIWYNPHWQMADPIATLLFSCLVMATTYGIFTRSVVILMEGAPIQLNLERIETQIRKLDAVYDCHDLRVWSLTEGRYAASVHVLANGDHKAALKQTQQLLKKFGVHMQTVQIETSADFDWESEGDSFCMNTTFSTSEVMMSVPRASTSRASSARFTIDGDDE